MQTSTLISLTQDIEPGDVCPYCDNGTTRLSLKRCADSFVLECGVYPKAHQFPARDKTEAESWRVKAYSDC